MLSAELSEDALISRGQQVVLSADPLFEGSSQHLVHVRLSRVPRLLVLEHHGREELHLVSSAWQLDRDKRQAAVVSGVVFGGSSLNGRSSLHVRLAVRVPRNNQGGIPADQRLAAPLVGPDQGGHEKERRIVAMPGSTASLLAAAEVAIYSSVKLLNDNHSDPNSIPHLPTHSEGQDLRTQQSSSAFRESSTSVIQARTASAAARGANPCRIATNRSAWHQLLLAAPSKREAI
jgi:hypothetical protein